jgi:hypothetical protein
MGRQAAPIGIDSEDLAEITAEILITLKRLSDWGAQDAINCDRGWLYRHNVGGPSNSRPNQFTLALPGVVLRIPV